MVESIRKLCASLYRRCREQARAYWAELGRSELPRESDLRSVSVRAARDTGSPDWPLVQALWPILRSEVFEMICTLRRGYSDLPASTSTNPFMKNLSAQALCIWSGPMLALLFLIGFVILGGYVPPPGPSLTAPEIAEVYTQGATRIRIGMFVCVIAMTLIAPWGIGLALRTQSRHNNPALFITQISMAIISSTVSILSCVVWSLAAFRPAETPPEITRAINDGAWFFFLLTWPSFSIWMATLALSILDDPQGQPAFPRWTAYLSFWTALLLAPAGLIPFFKEGPFAWNGLFAFYLVVAAFFVWVVTMTTYALRSLGKESRSNG